MEQPENPNCRVRRHVRRYRPRASTLISCWESERNLALGLLNLSEGGTGLLLSEELGQGQSVQVGLQADGWPEEVRISATVLSVCYHVYGGWRTSVAFTQPLGLDALRDLCQLPG